MSLRRTLHRPLVGLVERGEGAAVLTCQAPPFRAMRPMPDPA